MGHLLDRDLDLTIAKSGDQALEQPGALIGQPFENMPETASIRHAGTLPHEPAAYILGEKRTDISPSSRGGRDETGAHARALPRLQRFLVTTALSISSAVAIRALTQPAMVR